MNETKRAPVDLPGGGYFRSNGQTLVLCDAQGEWLYSAPREAWLAALLAAPENVGSAVVPPTDIYYSNEHGEVTRYVRGDRDDRVHAYEADDLPEDWYPLPAGWLMFDGVRRNPTAAECERYGHGLTERDEWWDGQMRDATVDEVVAFFRLPVAAPKARP